MPMTTEMTTLHRTSPLTWHCTLSTLTSTSTESAHHECAQSCSFFTFTTLLFWLKFDPCPHSTHDHHHGHPCDCCLFDLTSSLYLFAFLLSVFLFPSSTSATSSSRSSTRRTCKTCATPLPTGVRVPTTSSTSPQTLSCAV